ncbi:hypothetical protein D9757_011199 [Collybiopsis confluens]|uniref:Uncharacterized protein n=1 Tax=Collybiopsis confluens TaxID=2823264 RepID=A0A8H5LZJ9_9AGAR|nr:hypothetical protein D9757_011199 [Collybiopsis confluens]
MNVSVPISLLVADAGNASSTNSSPSCDPDSTRTALGILWSCLSVLFACTWVSVHPNVPGPNEGFARRLWTKITLMWYAARRLTKGYKGWTKTHAFFALMVAEAKFDDRSFAAHASFICGVRKDELEDRNKSNSFAKLIAVAQTTWFVVQLCARWATNLPVTELEVMTLAFATMNLPIYFFWWNKPLGVGVSIRIQRDQTVKMMKHLKFDDIFEIYDSFESLGLLGKIFYLLVVIPLRLLLKPAFAIIAAILADGLLIDDGPLEEVESFERTLDLEPKNAADKLIAYGAAMIFGAIHCIAWTSQFPSAQEKILWHVCSLLVACIPIYLALVNVLTALKAFKTIAVLLGFWFLVSLGTLYVIVILLYILARLSLLVQGFLALRALPPAALEAVQWTNFLPHI